MGPLDWANTGFDVSNTKQNTQNRHREPQSGVAVVTIFNIRALKGWIQRFFGLLHFTLAGHES